MFNSFDLPRPQDILGGKQIYQNHLHYNIGKTASRDYGKAVWFLTHSAVSEVPSSRLLDT